MMQNNSGINRIILKVSGESLIGNENLTIDPYIIQTLANDIAYIKQKKIQMALVIGGGNFIRGASHKILEISRVTGDYMGMLATLMNAIVIQDIFLNTNIPTKIMAASAVTTSFVDEYQREKAIEYLNNGYTVIFAGGTGNPLVTTDTALFLRGIELQASLLLKGTNVDGVYSSDPKLNCDAQLYNTISYNSILDMKLNFADSAALSLGKDYKMKFRVFNIKKRGALLNIINGIDEGTLVK